MSIINVEDSEGGAIKGKTITITILEKVKKEEKKLQMKKKEILH